MSEFLWSFPSETPEGNLERPMDTGWALGEFVREEELEFTPAEAS